MDVRKIIDKLYINNSLDFEEIVYILENIEKEGKEYLIDKAHETRVKIYGDKVYMRGLLEFTNYCKRDCKYCGISIYNKNADRYRLELEEILLCCKMGYELGYRTFVLQGGEDSYYSDDMIVDMIKALKSQFKDIAITLSIGEKPFESYERYYNAGVDRYLLRHETASEKLFEEIHGSAKLKDRIDCLWNLKRIGYQVGAGFMVGIPGQTKGDLAKDLLFIKELEPEMVGIGPFIPHKDTIYKNEIGGTLEDTITMIAMTRLFLPKALLPATTALGTISPLGREMGIKAGANVVMPNLSPISVREKYSLYDGKICTGDEAAECRNCIENRIKSVGFMLDMSKGDHINWRENND